MNHHNEGIYNNNFKSIIKQYGSRSQSDSAYYSLLIISGLNMLDNEFNKVFIWFNGLRETGHPHFQQGYCLVDLTLVFQVLIMMACYTHFY